MAHKGPHDWSMKYGTASNAPFYGFRSGLSPTELLFLNDQLINQHRHVIDYDACLKERYQRENLHGFTTRELFDLEAITLRSLRAGNLQNGIIPFLDKANWQDVGNVNKVLLNTDNPNIKTYFSVEYPKVWAVLQPVLVIASRIIQDAIMEPYFKALFHGTREPVARDRIPQDILDGTAGVLAPKPEELRTIRNSFNPPPNEAEFRQLTDALFVKMKDLLRLGFKDGNIDPRNGKDDPESDGKSFGYCDVQESEDGTVERIWIFLDYREYGHLLRNDLTDCDRMGLEWFNASVLIHELAHAFDFLKSTLVVRDGEDLPDLTGLKDFFEPYFENEVLAELGYAMENSVFGGLIDVMQPAYGKRQEDILPLGFWFDPHWPAVRHRERSDKHCPTLKTPPISTDQYVYPVLVHLFEDVQQEDFWSVAVRKFGCKVLQLRSLEIRQQMNYGPDQRVTSSHFVVEHRSSWDTWSNELLMLAGEGQEARDAFSFAKKMYVSARQAERYWVMSRTQNRDVENILHQIHRLRAHQDPNHPYMMPPQNEQNFLRTQITYLGLAITAHGKVVDELLALEAQKDTTEDIYRDRRYTLLTFNRGTRIFARQLKGALQSINYIIEAHGVLLKERELECSWMKLFNRPNHGSCGADEDQREYWMLHQIFNSYESGNIAIHQQLRDLENSPGLSQVWISVARLLHGAISPKTVPAVQRYNEVRAGLHDLVNIKHEAAQSCLWPTWWKMYLDLQIKFGNDQMDAIRKEAQPAQPIPAQPTPAGSTQAQR